MFDRKVNEFARREQAIAEKEALIVRGLRDVEAAQARANAMVAKVKKTKETRVNLKALERKQAELSSSVAKLANRLIAKSQKIKIPPAPLAAEEVTEAQETITHEKSPTPAAVMPKHKPKHERPHVEHDPAVLMDKAREAMDNTDYAGAQKALEQAEKLIAKMPRNDHKRDLSYQLWDLKTSLRMASLG
jgi:hypothetical protein